jgi:hypothetical protein
VLQVVDLLGAGFTFGAELCELLFSIGRGAAGGGKFFSAAIEFAGAGRQGVALFTEFGALFLYFFGLGGALAAKLLGDRLSLRADLGPFVGEAIAFFVNLAAALFELVAFTGEAFDVGGVLFQVFGQGGPRCIEAGLGFVESCLRPFKFGAAGGELLVGGACG